jgi:DNA-binding LacI/PurR family transcriptional regulator
MAAAVGLTSVSQPVAEAAARCVQLLAGLLDKGRAGLTQRHVLLEPRLVIRRSG